MLVPLKEMTDVLSVKTKAVHLSRGAWVRMRNGMYKGELAKVVNLVFLQFCCLDLFEILFFLTSSYLS